MKVQFEDYFGNDIVILDFADSKLNKKIAKEIDDVCSTHGYAIADIDDDDVLRLQNIVVNKGNLINAIKSVSEILIKIK